MGRQGQLCAPQSIRAEWRVPDPNCALTRQPSAAAFVGRLPPRPAAPVLAAEVAGAVGAAGAVVRVQQRLHRRRRHLQRFLRASMAMRASWRERWRQSPLPPAKQSRTRWNALVRRPGPSAMLRGVRQQRCSRSEEWGAKNRVRAPVHVRANMFDGTIDDCCNARAAHTGEKMSA